MSANAYLDAKVWQIETTATETSLSWDMSEFGGWYDFSVSIQDEPTYGRRFAGRIETAQDSISDPFMGYLDRSMLNP